MTSRILHLTEALGGGVLHCIALLANEQARYGCEVTLVHSIRGDTPGEAELARAFDPRVRRVVVDLETEIGVRDLRAALTIFRLLRGNRYDAIHFHSSKAGALGRVAAFCTGQIGRTCYSPHGFSFLRRDISTRKRKLFWWFERSLHAIGGKIAACSQSEQHYAQQYLASRRAYLLENAIDVHAIPARKPASGPGPGPGPVRVATAGRVTYAKAPWRLAALARALAADRNGEGSANHGADGARAEFVWLGDGDEALKAQWIGDAPVAITGWLDKPALLEALRGVDVFLFTSLWEGMPIALIEAQTVGIPAVATNIVGNRDIVVHGITGFLADSEEQLAQYTRQLVADGELRRRMGDAARENAFRRFGKERFLRRSLSIYFGN